MIRTGWARPVGTIGLGAALIGALFLRGDDRFDPGLGSFDDDVEPPAPAGGLRRALPAMPHPAVRAGTVPLKADQSRDADIVPPVSRKARLLASASEIAASGKIARRVDPPVDPLPRPDFSAAFDMAPADAEAAPGSQEAIAVSDNPVLPTATIPTDPAPGPAADSPGEVPNAMTAPAEPFSDPLAAAASAAPASADPPGNADGAQALAGEPAAPQAALAPVEPTEPAQAALMGQEAAPAQPESVVPAPMAQPQVRTAQVAAIAPIRPPAEVEPVRAATVDPVPAAAVTVPSDARATAPTDRLAMPAEAGAEPDAMATGPVPEAERAAALFSAASRPPIAVVRTPGSARRTISTRRDPMPAGDPQTAKPAAVVAANDRAAEFPRPEFGSQIAAIPASPDASVPLQAKQSLAVAAAQGSVARSSSPAVPRPGAALPAKLAPAGGSATFPTSGPPTFSYDDELILQVRVADYPADDTLVAYGTRDGVYLPFGVLARLLDLGIAVSDDGNYASGWFLNEKRTLTIDLRQHRLIVSGQASELARRDAIAFDGDLYLRAERYADILPLDMMVNLRDQSVTIRTREPFPFEQRLKREAERAVLATRSSAEPQHWPREETPWRALSLPIVDLELRAMSDSTLGSRGEADLRLAGDVAFMTGQAYLSGTTRDGLISSNISLGRADADGDLFGPLRATEFAIGDISTPALPIGLRGTGGRGAFIGNVPIESRSVFDRIDLRGVLPDGYEVELYRNDILIGSTREPINGEYRFEQVSLDYGLNVLRLVFYGPQGQRTEEVRRISVGDGRLGKGQIVYSAGIAQKDVNLLDVRGPRFFRREDFGAWRAVGQLSYGFTTGLTGTLGGAWFQSDRGTRWMGTAGLRTGIAGIATRLDLGLADGGAKAATIGLGTRLLGASLTFNHGEYRGKFIDEVRSPTGIYLRRVSELEANATITLGSGLTGLAIPVAVRARRLETRDGHVETSATVRASTRFSGLLASNTLDFSQSTGRGMPTQRQLRGSFDLASLSRAKFQLRGSVGYAVLPKARIVSGAIEVDRAIDDRTIVHGAVSHAFEDHDTHFGLSAVRRFDRFTLAVEGSYGLKQKTYSASLRLGMSLGRNPISGSMFMAPPGQASSGAIALRAFHDLDGDRRFGPGDKPIEGVDFFSGNRIGKTDAQGVAMLTGLGSGSRVSVQADLKSLPDIDLSPVSRGIEIVARPGRIHRADYPVVELSQIEGTAFYGGGEAARGVSGLRLQLIDAAGIVIKSVRTESDGFYLLEQIRPGTYSIRLDPEQAARLRIRMADPVDMTIGARAAVLSRKIVVEGG